MVNNNSTCNQGHVLHQGTIHININIETSNIVQDKQSDVHDRSLNHIIICTKTTYMYDLGDIILIIISNKHATYLYYARCYFQMALIDCSSSFI